MERFFFYIVIGTEYPVENTILYGTFPVNNTKTRKIGVIKEYYTLYNILIQNNVNHSAEGPNDLEDFFPRLIGKECIIEKDILCGGFRANDRK